MPIVLAQLAPPPAVAATSSAADPATPRFVPPAWQKKPTGEDIVRVYPLSALRAGIEGDVVMHCAVTEEGLLADCVIAEEKPSGKLFGEATLKLSKLFKMRLPTTNGVPDGPGSVSIPIHFRVSH